MIPYFYYVQLGHAVETFWKTFKANSLVFISKEVLFKFKNPGPVYLSTCLVVVAADGKMFVNPYFPQTMMSAMSLPFVNQDIMSQQHLLTQMQMLSFCNQVQLLQQHQQKKILADSENRVQVGLSLQIYISVYILISKPLSFAILVKCIVIIKTGRKLLLALLWMSSFK